MKWWEYWWMLGSMIWHLLCAMHFPSACILYSALWLSGENPFINIVLIWLLICLLRQVQGMRSLSYTDAMYPFKLLQNHLLSSVNIFRCVNLSRASSHFMVIDNNEATAAWEWLRENDIRSNTACRDGRLETVMSSTKILPGFFFFTFYYLFSHYIYLNNF